MGVGWAGVGGGGCTNVHVVVLPRVKMLHGSSWDMVAWDMHGGFNKKDLFQATGCLLYKEAFG